MDTSQQPLEYSRGLKETRYIMDAYVGAVFFAGGYQALFNWINALVQARPAQPAAA